jgi:hypothetical protein
MNPSAPGRDTSLDGPITETEAPMPDYGTGSFILSNVGDSARNDANLVFDSTGGSLLFNGTASCAMSPKMK